MKRMGRGCEWSLAEWMEENVFWKDEALTTLPLRPLLRPSYLSDAVLGSACFFLDHLSLTDQTTLYKKI